MEAQERLLRRVLRQVQPPEKPEPRPQHHPLVPLHEDGERLAVSRAGASNPLGGLHDRAAAGLSPLRWRQDQLERFALQRSIGSGPGTLLYL
jgi:hypothetical protein